MAAIFDFSLIRTSDSLRSSLVVSLDLKNMTIAVGILLLSCIETELRLISFFFSRHLGFLTSGFIRQWFWWCHWKVYPRKHRVRHPNCVFITSDSWVTRGGNLTTPRGPSYTIRSAVRGLSLLGHAPWLLWYWHALQNSNLNMRAHRDLS